MTEENIRGQISAKEDEITRIEEEASKEEASAESKVETEYDPKIEAAINFIRSGGEKVVITSGEHLQEALVGNGGTLITKN